MGEEAAHLDSVGVSQLTAAGVLRLVILPGNPLTNAQIDMLVPSWEKNKVFTSSGGGGLATSRDSADEKAGGAGAPAGTKSRLRKRRNWDEEEPTAGAAGKTKGRSSVAVEEDDGFPPEAGTLPKGVYHQMGTSLDEALSEISDREGLTDGELQLQIARLRATTDSLPKDVSSHLK